MQSLAKRVLSHIRRQELLRAGDRVGVAVSGGVDSVALLRLLLELRGELGIVLSVVHFNHKLRRVESDADEQSVANLAREHGLGFFVDSEDVGAHAVEERVSVETAARELRYGFFRHLLDEGGPQGLKPSLQKTHLRGAKAPLFHGSPGGAAGSRTLSNQDQSTLDKIVTGHTLDDQAETVLMRMIRGAGMRGLGGIHPRIAVDDEEGEVCGEILRPLLGIRRRELEQFLNDIGQSWREDSTNSDTAMTRNRIRKLVVPLLEKEFNPGVAENLAELAAIARDEEDYWENEVAGWMGTAVHWSEPDWARAVSKQDSLIQIATIRNASAKIPTSPAQIAGEMGHPEVDDLQARIEAAPWLVSNASVDRLWFLGEPVAVQRRLVKAIGEHAGIPLEFKHVDEILRFATEDESGKELSLPRGWMLQRDPDHLIFLTPDLRDPAPTQDYDYALSIPGQVFVNETGSTIEARRVPAGADAGYNPDHLLDADSLPGPLRVRNWRPGDRFWPAHTKSPKKIKELLQERHVPQPERKLWPVVASAAEIVWMRGFRPPAKLHRKLGRDAVLISESSLPEPEPT